MNKQLERLPMSFSEGNQGQLWFLSAAKHSIAETRADANLAEDIEEHETLLISPRITLKQRVDNSSLSIRFRPVRLKPLQVQQQESTKFEPRKRVRVTGPYNFDDDPEFDKRSTLPMLVLKEVSKQQNQTTPAMHSAISGAASGAAFAGIGAIATIFFKYGNTFLLQRSLDIESFGRYSIGMSVVSLVSSVLILGLDDVMVRYIAIYRDKQQTSLLRGVSIFCTAIAGIAGILGALFIIVFAPFLATIRQTPEVAPLLQLMAPMVPLLCIQAVFVGGMQGFKEFKKRVLSQRIIVPMFAFFLLAGVLLLFHSANAAAVVALVSTMSTTVLCLYFLFHTVSSVVKSDTETYQMREWFGFAILNFLTTVIDTVLDSIDTLLLTFFAIADASIGQYNAAIKVSSFIALPLTSLNTIFAPTIAELHSKGEKQKLEAMFKIVTKWAITFTLPIFGIVTLFSTYLLVLSGDDYVAAWPLLVVFAVGGLVNVATGPVGFMLLMTGYQKYSFLNSIAAIAVNIVLGLILTPRYGAMGTAISTGIATCVVNCMRLLQVILLLKMQPYRWDTLKPVAAGVISATLIAGLLYLLRGLHWGVELFHIEVSFNFILVPVFVAIYAGLLVLFKISPEDKIVLNGVSKKLRRGKK